MTPRQAPPASDPCVRRFRARPAATRRLFCLPHAGGGANGFRSWPALFADDVDVAAIQYPGRENRLAEPLLDAMPALATAVADALEPWLDRPWTVFGHSMGAAVAHEALLILRRRGAAPPHRLVVSAREGPSRARGGDVHRRDEAGLVAELARQGGTAGEILASPELREFVLPIVRNDYRLVESYRPTLGERLDVPVTVVRGEGDPDVDARDAAAWAEATTGPVTEHVLPGDHFYLHADPAALAALLVGELPPGPPSTGRPHECR